MFLEWPRPFLFMNLDLIKTLPDDFVPGVIYGYDLQGAQEPYMSVSYEALLGYNEGELGAVGPALMARLLHPEDRGRVEELMADLLKVPPGQCVRTEYRLREKSGQWRWFRDSACVCATNEQGQMAQIIGIALDVDVLREAHGGDDGVQALFERVLDVVPLAVSWKDAKGTYLGCNRHFLRSAGLPPDTDIKGKRDAQLPWREVNAKPFAEAEQKVLKSGQPDLDRLEEYARKDAPPLIFRARRVPLYEDERVAGVLCVHEDVTDSVLLPKALENLEERYQFIFQTAPHGTFIADAESLRLFEINVAGAKLLRERVEDCIKRPFTDWVGEEEREAFLEWLKRVKAPEPAEKTQLRLQVAKGEQIEAVLYARLIPVENRSVYRFDVQVGVAPQVTEPRGLVIELNEEGCVHRIDAVLCERLGLEEGALEGKSLRGLLEHEERAEDLKQKEASARSEVKALQGKLAAAEKAHVAAVTKGKTALEEAAKELEKARKDESAQVRKLEACLARLEAANLKLQNEKTQLETARNEAEGALREAREGSEEVRKRSRRTEQSLQKAEAEKEQSQKRWEEAQERVKVVQAQLTAARNAGVRVPFARLVLDAQGNVEAWNEVAEKLFGYTEGEALGKPVGRLLLARKERPRFRTYFEEVLENREGGRCAFECYDEQHKVRLYEWVFQMCERGAQSKGVEVFVLDPAAQTVAEPAQLSGAGARQQGFWGFEQHRVPMLRVDAETLAVVECNQGAERFYGCSTHAMQKKTLQGLSGERVEVLRSRLEAKGEEVCFQTTHQLDNGQRREVEVCSTGVWDERNRKSYCLVVRDISARREQEEARLSLDAARQKEVHAELLKAKEAAEQACQAKSALLATMNGEIRAPLNAVLGFCELLRDTTLDAEQRDYLERIGLSGHTLMAILNNVLDLTRVEGEHLELEPAFIDPRSFLEEVVGGFRKEAAQKGIELVYGCESSLPNAFEADPRRLRQIVANLLSNAVYFTEHGSIRVRLYAEEREGVKATICIQVVDTGCGIPKQLHKAVFSAFAKAENRTMRHGGGVGLGLAIAERLARVMGGSIELDSHEGRGSAFTVRLRVPVSDSPAFISARSTENPFRKEPREAGVFEILLVEPNALQQSLVRALVEKMGHPLAVCGWCAQADAFLKEKSYDVLLLSPAFSMEEIRGFARALCAASVPELRPYLVFMMAEDQERLRKEVLAAGMDECVTMPLRREALQRVFARAKNRRHSKGVGVQ